MTVIQLSPTSFHAMIQLSPKHMSCIKLLPVHEKT